MVYSIRIKKSVEKDLKKIDKKNIERIIAAMETLKDNPRQKQSIKLKDTKRTYRLRVGDYRIIYHIDDEKKEIVIFHVRHRRDAYRDV